MAKMRSPNYPAVGLDAAIGMAKALWAKEKRTAVPDEVAAKAMGYSSLSGPARSRLAALKKYGLIEGDGANVRVSDLALQILHPASEEAKRGALKEAALNPELFKDLYDSHAEGSDHALAAYLIQKLGFSEIGAKRVIGAFRDTLRVANLGEEGYSSDTETQGSESMPTQVDITKHSDRSNQTIDFSTLFKGTVTRKYPLDISIPRGLKAELAISGDFKREDLERLQKQISRLIENLQDAFAD